MALVYSASLMGPTGRALMGCFTFQFTQEFLTCRDLSEPLSTSCEVAGLGVC